MKKGLCKLRKDNQGIGVVEIILILVILIALVIIFKNEIIGIVETVLGKIKFGAQEIENVIPTPE